MSKSKRNTWMLSPALGHALMIVERIVVQNIWQGEQLLYRNVNLVPASLCAVVHACMCVPGVGIEREGGVRRGGSGAAPSRVQKTRPLPRHHRCGYDGVRTSGGAVWAMIEVMGILATSP